MILNKDQLLVIKLNADTLLKIGVTEALGSLCPECGTPVFAEREQPVHLCGYCGAWPIDIEDEPHQIYPSSRAIQAARRWVRCRRSDRPQPG